MAPKLRHRARAKAYQARARLRTTIRTRRLARQRRKAYISWARRQVKAELAGRSQRRAEHREGVREMKEIIRARRPGYKRAFWGRAASEEEKEVARDCLRIIEVERRRERRIARVELGNAMLDRLYIATYPYSERVFDSRAVAWMRRVQRRRRALGFRWYEVLPWLREERRRDRVEFGVMRARRAREWREGRWDRMREGVLREAEKYEKMERRERAREARRDWRRIRAAVRSRKRLRARKRAEARVRGGLKTVVTAVPKLKSLPKRTPFSVLKKKMVASVSRFKALSKKIPVSHLKKKIVATVSRLATLSKKTSLAYIKKSMVASVSRFASLPKKAPFSLFKKKKVADGNDAIPFTPIVSGAPNDQETASLREEVAPVGSVRARKWRMGNWRNVFGAKKIKDADESSA